MNKNNIGLKACTFFLGICLIILNHTANFMQKLILIDKGVFKCLFKIIIKLILHLLNLRLCPCLVCAGSFYMLRAVFLQIIMFRSTVIRV